MLRLKLLAAAVAFAFGGVTAPAYAQVYKWVDGNGVVNYSTTPPNDRPALKLENETRLSSYAPLPEPPPAVELAVSMRIERLERELPAERRSRQTEQDRESERLAALREQERERCRRDRRVDCDEARYGYDRYDHDYGPAPAVVFARPIVITRPPPTPPPRVHREPTRVRVVR
jgi:hypothetical protein